MAIYIRQSAGPIVSTSWAVLLALAAVNQTRLVN